MTSNTNQAFITRLITMLALLLAGCGGGHSGSQQIAQCSGIPVVAVVYSGEVEFPELAELENACVYSTTSTDPAELNALIDQARAAAGTPRVLLIGSHEGATAALEAMNSRPGYVDAASLWYPGQPTSIERLRASLVSVYLNDLGPGACEPLAAALRARMVPAYCYGSIENVFGDAQRRAALWQLGLLRKL